MRTEAQGMIARRSRQTPKEDLRAVLEMTPAVLLRAPPISEKETMPKKRKRKSLRSYDHIDWDKQPFGKLTDAEIGRQLGVPDRVVASRRRARGIPVSAKSKKNQQRGIDWDNVEELGKITDTDLAKKLGVSAGSGCSARRTRGIPAASVPGQRGSHHGIDWEKEPLGDVSDHLLATMLGVSLSTVAKARTARGIPPHRHKRIRWSD